MPENHSAHQPCAMKRSDQSQELMPVASWVEKVPEVCGGEARIRRTRIPVWLLVEARQGGVSESQLLEGYPSLSAADLVAAWAYYAANRPEIQEAIARQQQAMDHG